MNKNTIPVKFLLCFLLPTLLFASSSLFYSEYSDCIRISVRDNITVEYESQEAAESAQKREKQFYSPRFKTIISKVEKVLKQVQEHYSISTMSINDSLPVYFYSNCCFYRKNYTPRIEFSERGIIEFNFPESEYFCYFIEIAVESLPEQVVIDLLYELIKMEVTSGGYSIKLFEPVKNSAKWYEFWKW